MPSGPAFQVGNGFVQGGLGPDYPMLAAYRRGAGIAVALNAPAR